MVPPRFRAVLLPLAGMLTIGLVGVAVAVRALGSAYGFTPDQLAGPLTAGAAMIAAATVAADRPQQVRELHVRAARRRLETTWWPRVGLAAIGTAPLAISTMGLVGPEWGGQLALRNVALLTSWALVVDVLWCRGGGLVLPAAWAGTLIISSSAPPAVAAVWRAPLQPASTALPAVLTLTGLACLALAERRRNG